MYVARRESIKKNNKLSKVDWGITMSSTKNDISLKKRILKKNQPFHYFLYSNNKIINQLQVLFQEVNRKPPHFSFSQIWVAYVNLIFQQGT